MSEKIIRIKSGNEETTMNVTEESYEAWKDSASEEAGMARAGSWLPAPMAEYHIFLYIQQPQGGLRNFFIRHISISFPNRLQKNTMFL